MSDTDVLVVTVDQAAERLTLSQRTIRRAIKTGKLPAKKAGSRVLILLRDLIAWFQNLPSAQV